MESISVCKLRGLKGWALHQHLVEWGLVPQEGKYKCPSCRTPMALLKDTECVDGFLWVCPGRQKRDSQCKKKIPCGKQVSYREGTFLAHSHGSIQDMLLFAMFWVVNPPLQCIQSYIGINDKTEAEYSLFCWDVLFRGLFAKCSPIGGLGSVVEIDIGPQKQRTKPKPQEGEEVMEDKALQWVFGACERGSGNVLLVPMEQRDHETLVTVIRRWVRPGSIIVSRRGNTWPTLMNLRTLDHPFGTSDRDDAIMTIGQAARHMILVSQERETKTESLAKRLFNNSCRMRKLNKTREFYRLAGQVFNPLELQEQLPDLPRL